MKRMVFILLFSSLLIACNHPGSVPESLLGVKEVVSELDSVIIASYGWEPRDSTYNKTVDTVLAAIPRAYGETPLIIEQKTYDDARKTWTKFKKLCDDDKYKEALDYYFSSEEGKNGAKAGDFLVHLRHSALRYTFFSKVLLPLMQEYKGLDYAREEYIKLLQMEKSLEDMSIGLQNNGNHYVPDVYPEVITKLGYTLVEDGRFEEAFRLFPELINGIYGLTGDALTANFLGTKYVSVLYQRVGQRESSKNVWDTLINYLQLYNEDYEDAELEECLKQIQIEKEYLDEQ